MTENGGSDDPFYLKFEAIYKFTLHHFSEKKHHMEGIFLGISFISCVNIVSQNINAQCLFFVKLCKKGESFFINLAVVLARVQASWWCSQAANPRFGEIVPKYIAAYIFILY